MTKEISQIEVTSHVARDLLQSAALFNHAHLVVWEYVSNGLQYVDPGVNAEVRVKINNSKKSILISDNGRGMTYSDLHNYFVMHGENQDRKFGSGGRGYFGTGKSAAFGIADELHLSTVRNGKLSKISLSKSDIKSSDGSAIPVNVLEKEVTVERPNGTCIEIRGIRLKTIDQKSVIRHIESHLSKWRKGVSVYVNFHECEAKVPTALRRLEIRPKGDLLHYLGDCLLLLKVSPGPLSEADRGIAIYSNGVWHETTLGACEGLPMANYIFGEIDVPNLDSDDSTPPPFDMGRRMKLNESNELVQKIYGFISSNIETLRVDLVAEEKKRKDTAEARRLAKHASEISEIINDDFNDYRNRVSKAKAQAQGGSDMGHSDLIGDVSTDSLILGGDLPAVIEGDSGSLGTDRDGQGGGAGGDPRYLKPTIVPGDESSSIKGRTGGGPGATKKSPRGGFGIEFLELGEAENRAKYESGSRKIIINLQHPQFKAAIGSGSTDDVTFRRLAYEVAFVEYALALSIELAGEGHYLHPTDSIVDVIETLNRLSRRSVKLYEAV